MDLEIGWKLATAIAAHFGFGLHRLGTLRAFLGTGHYLSPNCHAEPPLPFDKVMFRKMRLISREPKSLFS
jgi:hypothetical protein